MIDATPHLSLAERRALGRQARKRVPRGEHGGWNPSPERADPLQLLESQNATRLPDLVPVRHGRMMVSPLTFFRGAAKIMATDLASTPTSGLEAQLCGDAHLSNFGLFASPERTLLFDLNDFDETLPGPFEYDLKRLATSFMIASRTNDFSPTDARRITRASVRAYREAMAKFAVMSTMDIWYARLSEGDLVKAMESETKQARNARQRKQVGVAQSAARKLARKAHSRNNLQALSTLAELVDGEYRIVNRPPTLVPLRDMTNGSFAAAQAIREQFGTYQKTLQDNNRRLLQRFEVVDIALKVVGIGSVGVPSFIVLLQGRDINDPLFLQAKGASASVLEDHLAHSAYAHAGERVVRGQRIMQAASDILLGWSGTDRPEAAMYWRQLRDMKAAAVIETMSPEGLMLYARLCGASLARAHARSGAPVAIAAYLGTSDRFDVAVADFAERYADQNEHDYQRFTAAIRSGRLQALEGV